MSAALRCECVVVGAGAVGLAVTLALALRGVEVVCLEAGPRAGEGVSSRSSEVVHAGLYFTATISRSSASSHFFLVDCEKDGTRAASNLQVSTRCAN